MVDWFTGLNPVLQALIATLFTWFVTALGAGLVFFFKTINRKVLDGMLGFAAGVMIAASYWSLLAPAIEMAEGGACRPGSRPPPAFCWAAFFSILQIKSFPTCIWGFPWMKPKAQRRAGTAVYCLCLQSPCTIFLRAWPSALPLVPSHRICPRRLLAGAMALALGIGIQNFPEGAAVSVPLRREGFSRLKSFWYGQASGMVEPIAGVLGAAAVILIKPVLPYALAFAAGAMIYVVVEELIPESQLEKNTDIATIGAMVGFAVMMTLDVALG